MNTDVMKAIPAGELKQLQIDILRHVAAFCKERNIKYFLCAGTMLGAVRHKGFIPWDDDIDIMLPRADYNRFLSEFPKEGRYAVANNDFDPFFPFPYSAVNDTRTIKVELKLRKKCTATLGVKVDVFPVDTVPDTWEEVAAVYRRLSLRWDLLRCAVDRFSKGKTWISTIYRNIGIAVYRLLEALGILSVRKMVRYYRAVSEAADGTVSSKAGVTAIYHYGPRESHDAFVYGDSAEYIFEGEPYSGVLHYHEYLSRLYGDSYMELPPPEMRVTHHTSDCYWKNHE